MRVIEYELLLDEERKPVLAKKNSGFSCADEFLNTPGKIARQDSCTRCSCMSWITMSMDTPEILKIRWIV